MAKKTRRTYLGYVAAGLTGMAMTATARPNENRQETGSQSNCLPIQVRTGESTTEQDQVILRGEVEDFGGNPYVTAGFLLRKHDPESDGKAFYETYTETIRVWNPNTYSHGDREGDGETIGPRFSRSYAYQQEGFEKESYQPGDEVDYWVSATNDVRGEGREDASGTVKSFTVPGGDGGDTQSSTLEIRSTGGGVAAYEFIVSDDLSPGSSDEASEVNGRRGHGHVGPDRGVDTFEFTGSIESFAIVGPATVHVDGSQVNPGRFDLPADAITEANFDPVDGTNELVIESMGGGVAAYEFAVTGDLQPGDDASTERIEGRSVRGRVGPDRGRDSFTFTGDLSRFRLVGPAIVSLNGSRVTSR